MEPFLILPLAYALTTLFWVWVPVVGVEVLEPTLDAEELPGAAEPIRAPEKVLFGSSISKYVNTRDMKNMKAAAIWNM